MSLQDHASSTVNTIGTCQDIGTRLTQAGSLDVLRRKHGPTSPIGYRCSNIIELIQLPELPQAQYDRQMADLQQLLAQPH
jgi:hypothetical protein